MIIPHKSLILGTTLALALAVWTPFQFAAEPGDGTTMMGGKTLEKCEGMQEMQQKMMDDCKAEDAKLVVQMAAMNRASPDKKADLMAAVLTTMAQQQITKDARRQDMQTQMMRHLMWHLAMGKESVAACPMMRDMTMSPDLKPSPEMDNLAGKKDVKDPAAK